MNIFQEEKRLDKNVFIVLKKLRTCSLNLINEDAEIKYESVDYPVFSEEDFSFSDEIEAIGKLTELNVIFETKPCVTIITSEKDPYLQRTVYYFKIDKPVFTRLYKQYKRFDEQAEKDSKGLLTIYPNGQTNYISPSGKQYEAKFGADTNSFRLLALMVKEPNKLFLFSELAGHLREARSDSDATDERRARDTVQAIRKKMKLPKDDVFRVDYGFGLKCDVQIKS